MPRTFKDASSKFLSCAALTMVVTSGTLDSRRKSYTHDQSLAPPLHTCSDTPSTATPASSGHCFEWNPAIPVFLLFLDYRMRPFCTPRTSLFWPNHSLLCGDSPHVSLACLRKKSHLISACRPGGNPFLSLERPPKAGIGESQVATVLKVLNTCQAAFPSVHLCL